MYLLLLNVLDSCEDLHLNQEIMIGLLKWFKKHEKTLRDQVYQGNLEL